MSPAGAHYGPAPAADDLATTYDACVVGSGAAGATVAWLLARAGLSVVVVEQGPHVTAGVTYESLLADAEPAWVRQANGTWGKVGYPWTTCNVGGGTVFYGGVSFRNRPIDFDAERALGPSELPLRWPHDPAALDPYYMAVEEILGVAGAADADPTLAPRGKAYPLPPIATSPEGAILSAAATAMGWQPFPTPLAIASQSYGAHPACVPDAPCICRQCPIGAKGDAVTRLLAPALAAGAKLFAGLKAVRLVGGPARAATALECVRIDSGRRLRLRASRFVVCANAVQTAALLLRSTSERHPDGMGNTKGLVGRGLCFKLSEYLVGYRYRGGGGPADSALSGIGPVSTCAVADLYEDPRAPGGLGGLLYEVGPEQTHRLRTSEQLLRIEALVPDEPQAGNRVRLGAGTDAHGIADVVMDYRAHPRDRARLEYMLVRGEEMLRAAGCDVVVREPSGWAMGSGHLHGTCRMGADPATSVVDADGRLHDADNVYVADGALLPFPAGVNPTLTIQAAALRVAHQLLAGHCAASASPITDLLALAPAG